MSEREASRVIIQAGGRGTRLAPYTTVLPKPLMPVDERPILEIMIRQLVSQGFDRITITLGYLGALIMAVLRNGSSLMQWPNYTQEIIIGGVIILAVGLDKLRQTRNA